MKCRIKKDKFTYRSNLLSTIHDEMSYEELVHNAIGFSKNSTPSVPQKTKKLLVQLHWDDDLVSFFVDVSSVSSLGCNQNEIHLVPITEDLLALYEKTSVDFIADYFYDE